MAKVGLSSPWATTYRQFQAFFKNDSQIKVIYNNNGPEIKILVDDPIKAEALTRLINPTREFGNVTLKITVVPSNKAAGEIPEMNDDVTLVKAALNGNTAVAEIKDMNQGRFMHGSCYIAFKREVVQYFNDNLCDLHGLTSTLYQDLAEVIFERHIGVYFCTQSAPSLGMPLGEWP